MIWGRYRHFSPQLLASGTQAAIHGLAAAAGAEPLALLAHACSTHPVAGFWDTHHSHPSGWGQDPHSLQLGDTDTPLSLVADTTGQGCPHPWRDSSCCPKSTHSGPTST